MIKITIINAVHLFIGSVSVDFWMVYDSCNLSTIEVLCFCLLVHYQNISIQFGSWQYIGCISFYCFFFSFGSRNLIWRCFYTFTSQSFQYMICFFFVSVFHRFCFIPAVFFLCSLCFFFFIELFFVLLFALFFYAEHSYAPKDSVNYFTMLHKITLQIQIHSIFRAYSAMWICRDL